MRRLIALAFILVTARQTAFGSSAHRIPLNAQAKVTHTKVAKAALSQVPQGKIQSAELEMEHGKFIWSFDISRHGSKNITEVQVDAKTGKVVSTRIETPEDQSTGAAADKKSRKWLIYRAP
jgi:uncharacterized membrane protein YkoI